MKFKLLILLTCMAGGLAAAPAPAATTASNDYSQPAAWLCRPDKSDGACHGPLNVLVVAADGHVKPQFYRPAPNAGIDCFYVYPTSSEDQTPNSDLNPGREIEVAAAQFGQFGTRCRQFAPIYRSVTVRALLSERAGKALAGTDHDLAYGDVRDAWNYYLSHDNHNRGVVLVGHSQGAHTLIRLLREEIDGRPIQQRIVSAIVPGWPVEVPAGKVTGGTFKSLKLCMRAGEAGCVMSWSSFRAELPPAANSPTIFGHGHGALHAACTNPAALGSDAKVTLDAYFTKYGMTWTTVDEIDTNYVRVPGLVSGQCVTRGEYTFLEITVNADPKDPRSDDIPGDVLMNGAPSAYWGLHRVDMAVVAGNLLDVIDAQAATWLASAR
jgi:hypothetical protein